MLSLLWKFFIPIFLILLMILRAYRIGAYSARMVLSYFLPDCLAPLGRIRRSFLISIEIDLGFCIKA